MHTLQDCPRLFDVKHAIKAFDELAQYFGFLGIFRIRNPIVKIGCLSNIGRFIVGDFDFVVAIFRHV